MDGVRKVGLLLAGFALVATGVAAQSSKFAATYDTDVVMIDVAVRGNSRVCYDIRGVTLCEETAGPVAEAELASLHVANWKELLMGTSGQVNLVTLTQAKGKNGGGTTKAIAEGTVRAGVLVLPEGARQGMETGATCARAFYAYDNGTNVFANPGPVILASRHQELSVTVDLDVVCAPGSPGCGAEDFDIEGSVIVALGLDTTASHHFNFVADDLDSGWYEILACYDLTALVAVSGVDLDEQSGAYSKVALGPRILTVQEVRATKDGVIDESSP